MFVQPIGSSTGLTTLFSTVLQRNGHDSTDAAQKLLTLLLEMRKRAARLEIQNHQREAPHGWSTLLNAPKAAPDTRPVPMQRLSAAERSYGTTQPLATSERNRLVHGEAILAASPSEAYTPRGLPHAHKHAPVLGHAHKDVDAPPQGSIAVTIPPSQARHMGLLGPREPDRSVTTSISKSDAAQLGLLPPGSSKLHRTATAYGADPAEADDKAALVISHTA